MTTKKNKIEYHASIQLNNKEIYILGEIINLCSKKIKTEDGKISIQGDFNYPTSNSQFFSYAYNLLSDATTLNSSDIPSFDLSVLCVEINENKEAVRVFSQLLFKNTKIISGKDEFLLNNKLASINYIFKADSLEVSSENEGDTITSIALDKNK